MAFSQFGTNSNARKKRVYYADSSTIYEGMPVCYDYDATKNILGYDKAAGGDVTSQSSPSTTAEGYQNEGKFLRVEDPTNNNIMHFAGVVAGNSYAGLTGERWLDIYIPNGAIVPVRCDVDTSTGVTLLAITVDSQEFGLCVAGTSRIVALAMETETGLDGTTDITLAKLDTGLSVYQNLDGTALSVGAGSGDIVANDIKLTTAQTAGRFTAFSIHAISTVAQPVSYDYALALYVQADFEALAGLNTVASGHWTNLTGGTVTGDAHLTSLWGGLYEDGATLTAVGYMTALTLSLQVTDALTGDPGSLGYILFRNDGAQSIDGLFVCEEDSDIGLVGNTDTPTKGIPIKIRNTTYWIAVCEATS